MDDAERFLMMRVETLEAVLRDFFVQVEEAESLQSVRYLARLAREHMEEARSSYNDEVLRSAGLPTTR